MVQSTIERALMDIDREIAQQIRSRSPIFDPRSVDPVLPRVAAPSSMAALPLPDYVEHRDGATEIGKLSAEAVVREYEVAAKDIEAVGAELVERARQCEAVTLDALAALEELKETARHYREQAKSIFLQIENCSLMTAEVRKTCTELKKKLAAPAAAKNSVLRPKKKVKLAMSAEHQ